MSLLGFSQRPEADPQPARRQPEKATVKRGLDSGARLKERSLRFSRSIIHLFQNLSNIARKIRIKLKANKNTKLNANYLFLLTITAI
jgi:hypothetical protein